MSNIEKDLLLAVADLHQIPSGAFSLRENGKGVQINSTENIEIVPKENGKGIDIYVKAGTTNESLHMPVIISKSGVMDVVYNDFHIGKDADVLIVAGCGVHNPGKDSSEHNGIHSFYLEEGAKVRYVEKHIGTGVGGGKILNPITNINLGKNSVLTMETTQLGGVSSSVRDTNATLGKGAKLVVKEKILTSLDQTADSTFHVNLKGEDCSADIISRSVARDNSKQTFYSSMVGECKCFGHVECDAILMDKASVVATPEIVAKCVDASLVHEAAIGKIAGEQLIKLKTLGLSDKEAEDMIISGFLS
ncbi:MAG: SufD family Fe-S cluster assembly protein [Clostridiales bacterium]|nr:SufD family Fe-S cluster assembly protein [Clostridiales bacterium]